jgi:2-polyprenyl-3-methyl-5-hydroxy-6-metoxy-1,4-benzoquinol methylase
MHMPVADGLKYDREAQAEIEKPYSTFAKVYKLIPADINVLDVGCHTGQFGAVLKLKGCRVTGIEIDAAAADHAKRLLDDVRLADVEAADAFLELDERYDVILFLDILEHCRWPAEILKRARESLKPQGFVVASIPNIANWSTRLNLLLGRFEYERIGLMDETHLRFYTIKTARKLFEEAGYKIELIDHRFSLPVFRVRKFLGGTLAKILGRLFPGLLSFQMIIKARPAALRTEPITR